MRWVRDEGYFERLVMLSILVPLIFVFAAIDWPSETFAIVALTVMGIFAVVTAPIVAKPLLNRWSRHRK